MITLYRTHLRRGLAAAVAAGVLAAPAAAVAAPPADPAAGLYDLVAVPVKAKYYVPAGSVVPAVIGVANTSVNATNVVLRLVATGDQAFARRYDNCRYNRVEAFCEFDLTLAPGGTYALVDPVVAVKAEATPERVVSFLFEWYTKEWSDFYGGFDSRGGPDAVRGTEGTLRLEPRTLTVPQSDAPQLRNLTWGYPKVIAC